MRGVIEEVWENESRNGQTYLTVQIDGERYNVWDTRYFDQMQEGVEIEYQFRQSGNFRHLTDIKPVEARSSTPHQSRPYRANNKDRQIARLSCLKSASEILAPLHVDVDSKRDMVIDTARFFERYVFEGDPGVLPHEDRGDERERNSR